MTNLKNILINDEDLANTQITLPLKDLCFKRDFFSEDRTIISITYSNQNPIKYLIKSTEINSNYYLETLGARFYRFFSSDSIVAKTQLINLDNSNVRVGSSWIDDFTPYKDNTPYIKNNKIVINIENQEKEIAGYISALITARFIDDQDVVGLGVNAGYNRYTYQNIKIDPGRSFGFMNLDDSKLSIAAYFTKKIVEDGMKFHGYVPLGFLEINNPLNLDQRFVQTSTFIDYYYPEYDTRDLLIGEITYNEILEKQSLYNQMASTIEKLVTMTKEELSLLIGYHMPKKVNGEYLGKVKKKIFKQLLERQKVMQQLYAKEIEYMKLYRANPFLRFNKLKILAQSNINYITTLKRPLINNGDAIKIKDKLNNNWHLALQTKGICPIIALDPSLIKSLEMRKAAVLQYPSLIRAIETDDLRLVQVMLQSYPHLIKSINYIEDVERNGVSIYTSALMRTNYINNKLEIAKLLLEYGANPREQIDDLDRVYDISDKVPHVIALEKKIVSEVIDSVIQRISPQLLDQNSLDYCLSKLELDGVSAPAIFSLFLAKEIIESPNIRYFAENILYLPKISLPEFSQSEEFWVGAHYTICYTASALMGVKLTLNGIISQAVDSSYYGVNLYLTKNNLANLFLFSDTAIVGKLIYYIQLYNLEKPHQEFSFMGAVISGSINMVMLYNIVANKPYFRNSNLKENMEITKNVFGFIKQATLIDYVIKSTFRIIEDEIINPVVDYFVGEVALDVLD